MKKDLTIEFKLGSVFAAKHQNTLKYDVTHSQFQNGHLEHQQGLLSDSEVILLIGSHLLGGHALSLAQRGAQQRLEVQVEAHRRLTVKVCCSTNT